MRALAVLLAAAIMACLAVSPASAHEGTIVFTADDGPFGDGQTIDLPRIGPHVVGLTVTDGNSTPLDGLDIRLYVEEAVQDARGHPTGFAPDDTAPMDGLGGGHYRATIDFAQAAEAAGVSGTATYVVVAWVFDDEGPTDDFAQIPYQHTAAKESPGPGLVVVLAALVAAAVRLRSRP